MKVIDSFISLYKCVNREVKDFKQGSGRFLYIADMKKLIIAIVSVPFLFSCGASDEQTQNELAKKELFCNCATMETEYIKLTVSNDDLSIDEIILASYQNKDAYAKCIALYEQKEEGEFKALIKKCDCAEDFDKYTAEVERMTQELMDNTQNSIDSVNQVFEEQAEEILREFEENIESL